MSTTYLLLCFIPLGLGMAAIVFRNSSLGFLIGLVGSGWLFFSYNHIEDERVIPALESMTKDLPWESFTRRSAKFGERWGTHCVAFGGSLPNKIHVNIGRSEYYSRFDMERKYHSNHLSVKTSDVSTTSTSAETRSPPIKKGVPKHSLYS